MRVESIIQRQVILMFAEMTKKYVEAAVGAETQNAVEKFGLTYNSLHEGYAILKEEVEEAGEEWDNVNRGLTILWEKIRKPELWSDHELITELKATKKNAEKLALEAVQVAAVCNKILNGLE